MIFAPRRWTRRSTALGLVLFPPGGPEAGHLIYTERARPLAPVLEIFRRELAAADPADAADAATLRPRLVITNEGEYAAVATARGASVQHDLGVVLLDDFYSLLHGVTRDPSRFAENSATFLHLLMHDLHQLGDRRRRFLYHEPAGWHGRPRGLETDYYPLDFPADDVVLTVMPALPRPSGAGSGEYVKALLERQREESDVADIGGPVAVRSSRLPGTELSWTARLEDRQVAHRVAVLEDDRFLYPVLLEGTSDLEVARGIFADVVNSIEPIPPLGGAGAASPSGGALRMWEEE